MGIRPSALALTVAISRLGAVSVLLRSDGDVAREAELGQVQRIIADPERASLAAELGGVHTFVLGGGGGPREISVPVTNEMEQIDPDAVVPPRWYRPDPGRATDFAFIVFTGEGAGTRMSRITNRRWALSAFGTASSAARARVLRIDRGRCDPGEPQRLQGGVNGTAAAREHGGADRRIRRRVPDACARLGGLRPT
jgi:putative long chain acyl-CoA synthase